MPKIMIVGARAGSLGFRIKEELDRQRILNVCAGVASEPVHLDATDFSRSLEVLQTFEPTHIICTVGINRGLPFYADGWETVARDSMELNYHAPMNLLAAFEQYLDGMPGTFVAISSNSAQIPRSSSAAYCASKAALSMGLRCAARDVTRAGIPLRVWGYEPGALEGTPMTTAVKRQLGADVPMSRMLTNPKGLPTGLVARMVARDVLDAGEVLHGTVVRLDNGEI